MFRNWFILLVSAFFLSIFNSIGQAVFRPPVQQFTPRQYGQLQTPENWAVAEDMLGRMYFGNANGVLEYDGETWDFIKVKDGAFVVSLAAGRNGYVFVGTEGDFGYIHPLPDGKVEYRSLLPLVENDIPVFGLIWRIWANDSMVVFQSEEAIFYYDYSNVTKILPETSFHLSFQSASNIYVRQRDKGIYSVNSSGIKKVFTSPLTDSEGVFGWFKDGDEYCALIYEMGFARFNSKGELISINTSAHFSDSRLTFAVELTNGEIAVGTADRGVLIINKRGDVLHKINQTTGINGEHIKSLYQDKRGNLWLAMETGIAWVNYSSSIHLYDKSSGLEGSVECFITTKNSIKLCGTSAGLYVLDEQKNHFVKIGSTSAVWQLFPFDQNILACTDLGIFLINENELLNIKKTGKLPNEDCLKRLSRIPMFYIEPFHNGHFIAAGPHGIYLLNNQFSIIKNQPLSLNRASGILKEKHHYWIGTLGQGCIRVYINPLSHDWSFDIYTAFDGLNDEWVKPIKFNGQSVFLTLKGLQRFVNEDEVRNSLPDSLRGNSDYERGFFDTFLLSGMSYSNAVTVLKKNKTETWLCVDNKISYYEKDFKNQITRPFLGFDLSRINDIQFDEFGTWICATEGLVFYTSRQTPDIHFKTLVNRVLAGKDSILSYTPVFEYFSFSPIDQEFTYPPLAYSLNSINFGFSALSVENGFELEYSFILEGHDETWSEWTTISEIRFNNLHEGNYTFRVKARNIYGDESEEAVLHFSILSPWYRTVYAYIFYLFLLVMALILASWISARRLKAQNKKLEGIVEERTREVVKQKDALKKQNEQIQHQNKEITDSISYAYRIQEAILPLKDSVEKHFPDFFIIYKPKDIVSGDFYWFAHVNGVSIIVCADCTGHGVPGGFMSMIGSDKLNHTVLEKSITCPAEILKQVNIGVKRSLKQEDEENLTTKDGMDIAICKFNHDTYELSYAGANRPLWILPPSSANPLEIEEIKATKFAIGGYTVEETDFTEHKIILEKGSCIYMSTDGFADQFGGEKGKKMMVKRMKEEIIRSSSLPMKQQGEILNQFFENWKNHLDENGMPYEQVDDVCLIGIRF
ncbi:MAG: SpoIIE family protein phosphatase [Flavobacteriales bacterium]